MSSKRKSMSLSDKINSLITVVPENLTSDDEAEEITKAKIVDKYEESDSENNAFTSTIRNQNISLLNEVDDRYKGKKVSGKDVYGDDDSSASENDSDDEEEKEEVEEEEEEEEEESETGDEEEDDSDEIDEDNPLRRKRNSTTNDATFKSMSSNSTLGGEVEKGQAVRQQLKLWEQLVEMRIQLQKSLISANQLPQFDGHKQLTSDKEFLTKSNESKAHLTTLLENLLDVQENLLKNNSETKSLLSPTNKKSNHDEEDEEITSSDSDSQIDNDEEQPARKRKRRTLTDFENILSQRGKMFKSYRDSVIQKWNDKTRLADGNKKGSNETVIKQIEYVLNDKSKLIKRTQLKRSEYKIVGKKLVDDTDEDGRRRVQEYDPEIYDDDDYYHQLLRELIEQKSADITDPIQLSKQWIQLQNMRNKMKRKIDTRATKGRRIRYNVHTKLVNFMAPIMVADTWSDLAKNELYNSLFGKTSKTQPTTI